MKLQFNPELYSDKNIKKDNTRSRVIRIFVTHETISLLNNKNISQYFIDETYKCISYLLKDIKALILLICYNEDKDLFELRLISTFSHEDTEY